MNHSDYILFMTCNLLTSKDEIFQTVYEDFMTRYEVNELARPNVVSLGGRTLNQRETDFDEWIEEVRGQGVLKVQAYEISEQHDHLTPAVANAFAGSQHVFLCVVMNQHIRTFHLRERTSSRYEITAPQFAAMINSQESSDILWKKIGLQILESNRLNNRPGFDEGAIKEYFISGKDIYGFEFSVDNLLSEAQVELEINDQKLTIPDDLKHLFYQMSASTFFPDDDKERVYLYPLQDVTAADLIDLLNAQAFPHEEIWAKFDSLIKSYQDPSLPDLQVNQWQKYVMDASPAQLRSLASTFCRAIAEVCEEKNIPRILTVELSKLFGPDDLDNKRANARSKTTGRWHLADNINPWQMFFYEEIKDLPLPLSRPGAVIKAELITHLDSIAAFAKKIDSPFHAAFSLAAYFLADRAPAGKFDEHHWAIIANDLGKVYSEKEIANAQQSFELNRTDLLRFELPEKINGLIAFDLADVFGGMGSWNDVYLQDAADQSIYQSQTATVFAGLRELFSSFISVSRKN